MTNISTAWARGGQFHRTGPLTWAGLQFWWLWGQSLTSLSWCPHGLPCDITQLRWSLCFLDVSVISKASITFSHPVLYCHHRIMSSWALRWHPLKTEVEPPFPSRVLIWRKSYEYAESHIRHGYYSTICKVKKKEKSLNALQQGFLLIHILISTWFGQT